ncbi:MAG: histidine phosphatase family protein [Planctomycetota bacterium]
MKLHLVRHGTAATRREGRDHPDRPLVPKGRLQLETLGAWYRSRGFRPDRVATSPFRRARESAEVFLAAAGLEPSVPLEVVDALVPAGEVEKALAALLAPSAETLLVFGHQPLLGALAASLLGADGLPLDLSKGGFIELDVEDLPARRAARLRGLIRPGHLR